MYVDYETLLRALRLVHDPRTTNLRRMLVVDTVLSVVGAVNALNYIGERLDEERYPEYHDVELGRPIFIVAAPRSGTTFLHRVMCSDPQFTALTVLEQAFSTISVTRAIQRLRAQGGAGARAFERLRDWVDRRSFSGWQGLHDTGIDATEEDEGIWAAAGASVSLWFLLPYPDELRALAFVDELPEDRRQALRDHYRGVLQRHLYMNPGKTLLGKNVLLPGRLRTVQEALPGVRFVHIVRHPYEAIASSLSLFTRPWRLTAPEVPLDGPQAHALAELMVRYYRRLHEESVSSEQRGDQRFYTVRYKDLVADPMQRVREIYDRFDLELARSVGEQMAGQLSGQASYQSPHKYSLEQFGLSKAWVQERLGDLFDHYGFER